LSTLIKCKLEHRVVVCFVEMIFRSCPAIVKLKVTILSFAERLHVILKIFAQPAYFTCWIVSGPVTEPNLIPTESMSVK